MTDKNAVYFEHRPVYSYPADPPYSPSAAYPEYPWQDTVSQPENHIYDMVRNCFFKLGMDAGNYSGANWNPLGEIIRPGNTVLIKPNMVFHENHVAKNGTDCLLTHASLVRAVADYAIIALKGSGHIIIGDAPLQSCEFEKLAGSRGYTDIVSFYKSRGINISLQDFRLFKSEQRGALLITRLDERTDLSDYTAVDLGKESMFEGLSEEKYKKLRITNYCPQEMAEHHNGGKNEYLIPNLVLSSDVVINMPKPKTHRKAGVTIALKNMIGINAHKDWLPHHTKGSVSEGGDEYLNKSWAKRARTFLQEKIDLFNIRGQYLCVRIASGIQLVFRLLTKLFSGDPFDYGSWYGNDTIWRTIADLNRILLYADKKGALCDTPQRQIFTVGDMIISGEKEGPLRPSPKNAGVIAAGPDPVRFDMFCATLMGFDIKKIPSINNLKLIKKYPLADLKEEPVLRSNNNLWDNKKIRDIDKSATMRYIASKGWQGHIEL